METKLAVVGAGRWGLNLVRAFHGLGVLGAVCDRDEAVLQEVAGRWPSVACHPEIDAVLRDDAITAVVIATPAATHAELARRALEADKDALVEKPRALTVREAERLADLAQRRARILMVGHTLRYHPAVVRLKEMARAGQLGRIQYVYSHRLNIGRIRTEENVLWSFAPHDVSVILGLLAEQPQAVACHGSAHFGTPVHDTTLSHLTFPSGVRAHIFVSWLHPFKEHRLVVVGSEQMAVIDDTAQDRLVLYPHRVEWNGTIPTATKAGAEPVPLEATEPLVEECRHFLQCVQLRKTPLTDAREAVTVLGVLEACQESISRGGAAISLTPAARRDFFADSTACVEEGAEIGAGTRIWHWTHVMSGARVGRSCVLGQNVHIASGAIVGNGVRIQNNVSVYAGVVLEDDVFLGPSSVLTNVTNPRGPINRHALFESTHVRRGATIGANATVLSGITIGRHAFVGAGAVVTRDVPDYGLVVGNPARLVGWMSRHGQKLPEPGPDGVMTCAESRYRYRQVSPGLVRCLDLDEDAPLPAGQRRGSLEYREQRPIRPLDSAR